MNKKHASRAIYSKGSDNCFRNLTKVGYRKLCGLIGRALESKTSIVPKRIERIGLAMSGESSREVRAGIPMHLARLWRYGLVLSGARDIADDLVQATCLRAIERADQFQPGTKLDRWLFSILRSIWFNELRARRIREGGGFVDASETLVFDGAQHIETNIVAAQVLTAIGRLPEAQREAVLLVYAEGQSYAEAAAIMNVPIGTVMSRLAAARLAIAKMK